MFWNTATHFLAFGTKLPQCLKGNDIPYLLSNLHHVLSATPLLDTITLLAHMSNTSTSVLAETLFRLEVGKSRYSAQFDSAEMLRSAL